MRFFLRFFVPFHNFVFRLTRGRALGQFELPVLLLTTTGRRSGKQRTIPLLYLEEDGTLLALTATEREVEALQDMLATCDDPPELTVEQGDGEAAPGTGPE